MDAATLLVEHYILLIKNIAYLTAYGAEYLDRMEPLVSRAVDHLYIARVADTSTCRELLSSALQDELGHLHSQHPQYAESLRHALLTLGR
ncbi:hypothetical protein [Herbaspirillum robiniae]|uniref:hypothetical protein n=1 Tax=Herbaspirillum robiniae TaxID=2014887 RepID=UPI000B541B71|nr:hypothetical protein [Herbaspirillum robiniae]